MLSQIILWWLFIRLIRSHSLTVPSHVHVTRFTGFPYETHLFKGVSILQRSVMLAHLLLMCFAKIEQLPVQCWPIYCGVNSIILYKLRYSSIYVPSCHKVFSNWCVIEQEADQLFKVIFWRNHWDVLSLKLWKLVLK